MSSGTVDCRGQARGQWLEQFICPLSGGLAISAIRFPTSGPNKINHCDLISSINRQSLHSSCTLHWFTSIFQILLGVTHTLLLSKSNPLNNTHSCSHISCNSSQGSKERKKQNKLHTLTAGPGFPTGPGKPRKPGSPWYRRERWVYCCCCSLQLRLFFCLQRDFNSTVHFQSGLHRQKCQWKCLNIHFLLLINRSCLDCFHVQHVWGSLGVPFFNQ